MRIDYSKVNALLYFFNKRDDELLHFIVLFSDVEFTKEIIEKIDTIFDKNGIVKDNASPELSYIRQQMESVKRNIHSTFDRSMRKYLKKGYLSDTKESFYDERRVLAVLSYYK